jgi:small subunit ribosomal protein S20
LGGSFHAGTLAVPIRSTEVPVANIKSQKKRIITNAKRAERNKAVKSELKTRYKSAASSIGSDGNTEDVRLAVKRIDMAAAKGIIHKNTAARRKSRLMKKVNASG